MIDVEALLATPLEHKWGADKAPRTPKDAAHSNAHIERAHALARSLPPSVEGHGGDEALFRAACELATVLGEDADAIGAVLRDTFNPRCAPPWDESKLLREASRAAERAGKPEARYARRLEERRAAETDSPAPRDGVPAVAYTADPSDETDWTQDAPPIEWYLPALGIAPSEGKITLIGGDPGAGKGPFADYLAIHFALGLRLFGKFDVRQCNVGLLDFEGAALTRKRIESHCKGLGVNRAELAGRLFHRRGYSPSMLDPELGWLRDWISEREIEVLVIDSYMSASAAFGVDPNAPEFAALAQALGALDIVVIVVAHARKPAKAQRGERPALGDIAGSFALGGMAQTAIAVWVPDDEDRTAVRIGCMRAPDEPFATLDVKWSRDNAGAWRGALLDRGAARAARGEDEDGRLLAIARRVVQTMRLHPTLPQTARAVSAATGAGHNDVAAVLGALARAGLAHSAPAGRGGGYAYTLGLDVEWGTLAWASGDASAERTPRGGPGAASRFRRH